MQRPDTSVGRKIRLRDKLIPLTTNDIKWVRRMAFGLVVGLTLALGFMIWALVFREIPARNESALLVVIGILSSNINTIVAFFFGRTVDDQQAQDTIATLANKTRSDTNEH